MPVSLSVARMPRVNRLLAPRWYHWDICHGEVLTSQ